MQHVSPSNKLICFLDISCKDLSSLGHDTVPGIVADAIDNDLFMLDMYFGHLRSAFSHPCRSNYHTDFSFSQPSVHDELIIKLLDASCNERTSLCNEASLYILKEIVSRRIGSSDSDRFLDDLNDRLMLLILSKVNSLLKCLTKSLVLAEIKRPILDPRQVIHVRVRLDPFNVLNDLPT